MVFFSEINCICRNFDHVEVLRLFIEIRLIGVPLYDVYVPVYDVEISPKSS